ncbi:MAG: guanylyltransferase [Methanobrevibacter sp.]|jgi:tRNA(His) 5'-end guanylyltransferase|nr:guanylyltransferase [Candidatus Methanovirga aequatorialis]
MKEHEIYSEIKVPLSSNLILRLDGRNFHGLSKKLNLKTPFDHDFSTIMVKTGLDIFKEFSPLFVYTLSDEINILFNHIPFSGRVEKLNSVFSSLASSSLTLNIKRFTKDVDKNSDGSIRKLDHDDLFPIAFDSRIILVSNDEIFSYFKWRQDEAYRNCINSYGYWALKEEYEGLKLKKMLYGLKLSDIHEHLFRKNGINLGKLPKWQRRGVGIYKKDETNASQNDDSMDGNVSKRNKFVFVDEELPKFNREFFNF